MSGNFRNDLAVRALSMDCSNAIRMFANAATPERVAEWIEQHVINSDGQATAERVAQRLQDTLNAAKAMTAELQWIGREGSA